MNTVHLTIDMLNDFLNPHKNSQYGLMDLNSKSMLLFARQELEKLQHEALCSAELKAENLRLEKDNEQLRKQNWELVQIMISNHNHNNYKFVPTCTNMWSNQGIPWNPENNKLDTI